MSRARHYLTQLLSTADIRVDGRRPWDIQVLDERFWNRVLRDKSLGLGESYMQGWWECDSLDAFFHRLLSAGIDQNACRSLPALVGLAAAVLGNQQTRRHARMLAKHHYDLGEDLFMAFLDPYHQYSCGYFRGTDDLAEAQRKKLELICCKLDLQPGDKLLDIGCGWGGLARYAAKERGCSVTGVTVSARQAEYARAACQGLDVDILLLDYRDMDGEYDKVVSVGMFEHVGCKNYRTFMNTVRSRLKDGGVFLLHTIGSTVSVHDLDAWLKKYIFPAGMLPSLAQIGLSAEGVFVIEDLHNLGPHYDRTLMAWHRRFRQAWPRLKERYPETFRRMWEYYLLCCAGAFRARSNQLWQIVMTKPGTPQPACRQT